MEMDKIIGKKVIAIRGIRTDKRIERIEPIFILFDDKKTMIELEEQDYYSYHDCSSSARLISVSEDEKLWNKIFNDESEFPPANAEI